MNIGIGGYDLHSIADLGLAFDYDSSGETDYLVFYRPGDGAIFILKNAGGGTFNAAFAQGDPGAGIGGYDLHSTADLGFAFDYDSSGKMDHLVFYRPGTGAIYILKNAGGAFNAAFAQGDPGAGIGGYDLHSTADLGFAFDYDSSGKMDHLVFYRPGTGAIYILKNAGGAFNAVFAQGAPGAGIGGYDLHSAADLGFSYDYDSSGKMDHMVFYRPGTGAIYILKNAGGAFNAVFAQGEPGAGIGGYDLSSTADLGFAFDYDSSGKMDHLVFYRPGTGAIYILKNAGDGTFNAVFAQGEPGAGIGGYDLSSSADRGFAYDYDGTGKMDHLVFYRPGTSTISILKNIGGVFSPVYQGAAPATDLAAEDLASLQNYETCISAQGNGLLNTFDMGKAFAEGDWIQYADSIYKAVQLSEADGNCMDLLTPAMRDEILRAQQFAMQRQQALHPGMGI
jgi:hypothetical protein